MAIQLSPLWFFTSSIVMGFAGSLIVVLMARANATGDIRSGRFMLQMASSNDINAQWASYRIRMSAMMFIGRQGPWTGQHHHALLEAVKDRQGYRVS